MPQRLRPRRHVLSSSLSMDDAAAAESSAAEEEAGGAVAVAPEDVRCPVCAAVMVEPVLLACAHEMCRACLVSGSGSRCAAAESGSPNQHCPLCKQRLAVWARRSVAGLVNQDKWPRIPAARPNGGQTEATADESSAARRATPVLPPPLPPPLYATQLSSGTLARKRTTSWLDQFLLKHSAAPHAPEAAGSASPELALDGGPRRPTAGFLRCDSVDSIGPEVNIFAPIEPCPCTPTKRPSAPNHYSFEEEAVERLQRRDQAAAALLNVREADEDDDADGIVRPTATRDGESTATKENQSGHTPPPPAATGDGALPSVAKPGANPRPQAVLGAWVLPEVSRKRPAVPVPRSGKRSKTAIGARQACGQFGQRDVAGWRGSGARSALDFTAAEAAGTGGKPPLEASRCASSDSSSTSERCSSTPGMSTPSSCGPDH